MVTIGDVKSSVTVSGKILVQNSAVLTFPSTGIIKSILKQEGEYVVEGEVLASLTQDVLVNQYEAATQNVNYQKALQAEILRGPKIEDELVSESSVKVAQAGIDRVSTEFDTAVTAAYQRLLSSGLAAYPVDKDNPATPPVITGTYSCQSEGSYVLSLYASNAPTGFSFRYSGLESGTLTAWTRTPMALGECGLYIQFDEDGNYRNSEWIIDIPNTRSALYLENRNAYELAKAQREGALAVATSNLALAQSARDRDSSTPSNESVLQAQARVAEASAVLASISAQIDHMIIKAPFSGQVTNVKMKTGETAEPSKFIKLLAADEFELEIYIPESNIRKVRVGDVAEVRFDAALDEKFDGNVLYISPQSMQIEGVSYYSAKIQLLEAPSWIREGLSADVEIIYDEVLQVPVVPKQYILEESGQYYVMIKNGDNAVRQDITLGLQGTNGLVEVVGLSAGLVLVRP